MAKANDKVADAIGRVRIEQAKLEEINKRSTSTDRQKIQQSEALARAKRAEARAIREAANAMRDVRDAGNGLSLVASASVSASSGMSALAKSAASFGGIGLAATATLGAEALVNLTGVALSAAQSLWVLPAAAGAGAAAFGTLKLATLGFTDAVGDIRDTKKFAEDLQSLSPNAQQAALSIQQLLPQFDKLKDASQDALFADSASALQQLADQYQPAISKLTTGIANAFNDAWQGVSAELMTNDMQGNIDRFINNTVEAFNKLSGITGPLTQALGDLMAVGSDFLPDLASGAADAAQSFADFIREAKESGKLHEWISGGLDTVKELGKVLWNAGDAIIQLAGRGKEYLPGLADTFKRLADDIDDMASALTGVVNSVVLVKKVLSGDPTAITDIKDYLTGDKSFTGRGPSRVDSGPAIPPAPRVFGPPSPTTPRMFPAPGDPTTLAPNDLSGLLGDTAPPPTTAAYKDWYGKNPYKPDLAVPDAPGKPGRSASAKTPLPTVPLGNNDPMSLLQGFPADASLYSAAGTVLDNRQKVAQAQSDVNALEASNTATQSEIQDKKNELARAQREQFESELRLNEAKQQATTKSIKGIQATHQTMSDLSAGLDADLGISKGIAGLADNLVKFVGKLATAPLQAQLEAITKANPSQGGYGLLGIAAAQGLFGPDYTGVAPSAGSSNYPIGPRSGYNTGYPGDAALLANVRPGRYSQDASRDLLKGLSDCSSSIGDLVNILDTGTTGSGPKLTTGNASDWLTAHGFVPGMGGPGDFRVGYNSGHMQATLPGGTPWNWGSNEAAARGGVGGTGADDPAFTQHYYRPASGGQNTSPRIIPTPAAPSTSAPSLPAVPNSGNILPPLTQADIQGLPFSMPGAPAGGPLSTGMPRGLPTAPLGPVGPAATPLGALPPPNGSGKGGIGMDSGGLLAAGMAAGGMALDMMAPGAGQAAQTSMKLIDRAIEFGSQAAGIGVSGLMETFLPTGGSELANNSWITKIAGGIAGAGAAIPNMAGKSAAEAAGQPSGGNGGQDAAAAPGGNTFNTVINAGPDRSGDRLASDWDYHMQNMNSGPST